MVSVQKLMSTETVLRQTRINTTAKVPSKSELPVDTAANWGLTEGCFLNKRTQCSIFSVHEGQDALIRKDNSPQCSRIVVGVSGIVTAEAIEQTDFEDINISESQVLMQWR